MIDDDDVPSLELPKSPHWRALTAEATLASEQMAAGARGLGALDPVLIGSFHTALFSLSIGYERMAKVALQIAARIETGNFLSEKEMRKRGHDIDTLLDCVEAMSIRRGYDADPDCERPKSDITSAITGILTGFARKGRYNYLDSLGAPTTTPADAEKQWDADVMGPIAAAHLSDRQRLTLEAKAAGAQLLVDDMAQLDIGALVRRQDVSGDVHMDLPSAMSRKQLYKILIPYSRMYALQPPRWLAHILTTLAQDSVGSPGAHGHVPNLSEFFRWMLQDDAHFRQRRDPGRG
ncbi:hypothetical protein [Rhodococcoides yunnanense]|uniref:hypothetical protein n=1 Tax=Rhodococcoides yunnanense TaxID=278209 RepID=UPI0022B1DF5B|nr:hypothetical protein [Rhodococcus yunnanensis]MCZ4277420.1 hypothetical protein [Rhodococcus yunnanensis]